MFQLHPVLENDSLAILETDTLLVRLIDDARFPWALIVPKIAGVTELHELSDAHYIEAMEMARKLGAVLKSAFHADKINTAAIGNMVAQLHIHVVARTVGDPAWPGPVWGAGTMIAYDAAEAERRIALIRAGLSGE
ncbi:HIT family protein [Thalassospiraceae bacterium LMO-JJ14]|nr:HIT family protein [Thalassospiraceae bacterium LMO-JJ14]